MAELFLLKEQTQFVWDCSHIANGVFFYHTEINGKVYSGKFIIELVKS
jgi:hypothetical protein